MFALGSSCKKVDPDWQSVLMDRQDAAQLGAKKPFAAVDDCQLRAAANVLYPVHAIGYNWLRSNQESGAHLAQEIDRLIAYYRSKNKTCDKVVIVTHSMGGLVARACAQLPGVADKILGIVHGVMPAIGAPATYKRMRAGFESIEQVVFGRNAAECTAVMANAPGPLELLPTAQYQAKTANGGQRHWLRASCAGRDLSGAPVETSTLLGERDPYADIYLNNTDAWWKLINEELIDPAGREEREKARREGREVVMENEGESDFDKFRIVMKDAKKLHEFIEDKYHPNTYAFYAADAKWPSWNEVHWKSDKSIRGDIKTAPLENDDHNGAVQLSIDECTHHFEIQKPQGFGDGTVPAESGEAPTPHVVQIFCHEGEAKGHHSYDHQKAYQSELAQAVTLYSIVKIVSGSDWLQQNLDKT
jgi:pimeloyl-ACP methyl ester carboxylesterase